MPRKNKRSGSKADAATAQYGPVFKKMRADLTAAHADAMKLLTAEAARHVKVLSEVPFWMQPAYLVKAREETGLSQERLADLIHMSRSAVANVEAGIRVTVGVVDKIYTALEQFGGIFAKNGLRGVLELDRETQMLGIEFLKRWLASTSAALEAAQVELAKCDAEISRLDQEAVAASAKSEIGTVRR